MLKSGGVVALDDYRGAHTPGVAAAVWEAVHEGRLTPLCVTPKKMYGVFGKAIDPLEHLPTWLEGQASLRWETQNIGGRQLIRIKRPRGPKAPAPALEPDRLARVNRKLKRIEAKLDELARPSLTSRVASRLRRH